LITYCPRRSFIRSNPRRVIALTITTRHRGRIGITTGTGMGAGITTFTTGIITDKEHPEQGCRTKTKGSSDSRPAAISAIVGA
jgi:hypothetical protein